MLRQCVYFERKSTRTEKSNLSECSFSCFHGCERVLLQSQYAKSFSI